MKCDNLQKNRNHCSCTYEPCPRKGNCCECLQFHWKLKELPGCLFPPNVEQSYDRSLERFIATYNK